MYFTLDVTRNCESGVFPKNTRQLTWLQLLPGPLDPESSTLTIRPLHLPNICSV